jgi:hypothetical protein
MNALDFKKRIFETMTKNQKAAVMEMRRLKPWDLADFAKDQGNGRIFIGTPGHGYLFIPKNDQFYATALSIGEGYSFKGDLGAYLEEDSEAPAFLEAVQDCPLKGRMGQCGQYPCIHTN